MESISAIWRIFKNNGIFDRFILKKLRFCFSNISEYVFKKFVMANFIVFDKKKLKKQKLDYFGKNQFFRILALFSKNPKKSK
jgi:hypothetical protein